jgi:hypothetical protein
MGKTDKLKGDRQSSCQWLRTKAKVSVVDTLKQQNEVWSLDQQEVDSHRGKILILLGDVRRDTSVAI